VNILPECKNRGENLVQRDFLSLCSSFHAFLRLNQKKSAAGRASGSLAPSGDEPFLIFAEKKLSGFVPQRVFNNENTMTASQQLLTDYVAGSDPAFGELVSRYVGLVYSAAVRLVDGDTHLAEDVTQTVFVDLARKAGTLSRGVMLGGWLHRHTCFVAAKTMRRERRRRDRKRQAVEMNELQDHSQANLSQVAPVIDEAINQLNAEDRTAILLRFFEQRDLRSVGEILGSTEDAARKRVARALEKLHVLLKHRGVALSAATLGTALATEAVTATPAAMATAITTTALAGAAAGTGTALTTDKTYDYDKTSTWYRQRPGCRRCRDTFGDSTSSQCEAA